MFCSKCGYKLSDEAKFCPKCGNQVKRPTSEAAQASETAEATVSETAEATASDTADSAVVENAENASESTADEKAGSEDATSESTADEKAGSEDAASESTASEDGTETGKQSGNTSDSLGDMIDKMGSKIGEGINSAVDEISQDLKDAGENISKTVDDAAQKMDESSFDWKGIFTEENFGKFAAFSLLLPFLMILVRKVLLTVAGGFTNIFGLVLGNLFYRSPFYVVVDIVAFVFVLAAAACVACGIYAVVKDSKKQTVWSYIILGGSVLSFISCVAIFWPSYYYGKGWAKILGFLCFLFGIVVCGHVFLRNKEVESPLEVGEDLGAYAKWYNDYKEQHPSGKEVEAQRIANDPEASYFDGDGATLFGLLILTMILSAITCSLATPWMLCKIKRWEKSHTVINGRRLSFDGTGGSLLGHWILWTILTVITCGIYSFFMYVALKKWEMQHTHYENEPLVPGLFDGNSFQYFGYGLLQTILLTLTCGLAAPWTITMIMKWEVRHEKVSEDRLYYDGTALGILGQYIIVFLLTVVTLGIYSAWGTVRLNKYIVAHTHVDKVVTE